MPNKPTPGMVLNKFLAGESIEELAYGHGFRAGNINAYFFTEKVEYVESLLRRAIKNLERRAVGRKGKR